MTRVKVFTCRMTKTGYESPQRMQNRIRVTAENAKQDMSHFAYTEYFFEDDIKAPHNFLARISLRSLSLLVFLAVSLVTMAENVVSERPNRLPSSLCYYTPETVVGLPENLPKISLLSGRYEIRDKPFSPGRFRIDNEYVFVGDDEEIAPPNAIRIPDLDFYRREILKLCKAFGDLYSPIAKEVYTVTQPVSDIPEDACIYYYVPNEVEKGEENLFPDMFYTGGRHQLGGQTSSAGGNHFYFDRGEEDCVPGNYLYHPKSNCAYVKDKNTFFDNPRFVRPPIGWIWGDGRSEFSTAYCTRLSHPPEPQVSRAVSRILWDYFAKTTCSNAIS